MKLRVLAVLLVLCTVFSGCMKIEQDTENLMRPPKLSVEQQQIFSALSAAAGADVALKYPKEGEYRSAFVMYDIDGDKQDEAIVFYTGAAGGDVRLNILDKKDGTWYSLYDAAGDGPDIESISFPKMLSATRSNIAIAFDLRSRGQKTLAVYSFEENRLKEEFKTDFTNCLIQDFDGDSRQEILLLNNLYLTGDSEAKLVDNTYYNGKLGVVSTLAPLNRDVAEYVQLSVEKPLRSDIVKNEAEQGAGEPAAIEPSDDEDAYNIFIDGKTGNNSYVTEIIGIRRNRLVNLMLKEASDGSINDYSVTTIRPIPMLTKDINDDGLLEFPVGLAIPGAPISSEESLISLICWNNFMDAEFYPAVYSLVNTTYQFTFNYPPFWDEKNISVQQQDGNEWRFYEYIGKNKSHEAAFGDELLRIRAFTNNDYLDDEGYQQIAQNDEFTYYAYIPAFEEGKQNELAITMEEFKALFHSSIL